MDEKFFESGVPYALGQNIKRIRLLKGLSQENLANALDKSINFISLVENGKTGISIPTLIGFCKELEVDANTILSGIIPVPENNVDAFITQSLNLFNEQDKAMVTDLITYIVNSKN